jgi:hypothetical protein
MRCPRVMRPRHFMPGRCLLEYTRRRPTSHRMAARLMARQGAVCVAVVAATTTDRRRGEQVNFRPIRPQS